MSFKDLELGGDGGMYYRLQDGENKVRIVGEPIPTWTSFNRVEKTAKKYLTKEAAEKDKEAKLRYAMWVIDRADGKIKVAELGVMIMKGLKTLATASETAFDGLPPFDIIITKSGAGMETDYTVMAARSNTALTPAEVAEIAAQPSILMQLREEAEDKDQVAPF